MLTFHFAWHQIFEIKHFKLLTFYIKNELDQHCVMFKLMAGFRKLPASSIRNFDTGK